MTWWRRRLVVLLSAVMMLVMAASPAWAAPGGNLKGYGLGIGGGDLVNPDNGQHNAYGGGQLNNPHLGF